MFNLYYIVCVKYGLVGYKVGNFNYVIIVFDILFGGWVEFVVGLDVDMIFEKRWLRVCVVYLIRDFKMGVVCFV